MTAHPQAQVTTQQFPSLHLAVGEVFLLTFK
jgi:hypothetical protein